MNVHLPRIPLGGGGEDAVVHLLGSSCILRLRRSPTPGKPFLSLVLLGTESGPVSHRPHGSQAPWSVACPVMTQERAVSSVVFLQSSGHLARVLEVSPLDKEPNRLNSGVALNPERLYLFRTNLY